MKRPFLIVVALLLVAGYWALALRHPAESQGTSLEASDSATEHLQTTREELLAAPQSAVNERAPAADSASSNSTPTGIAPLEIVVLEPSLAPIAGALVVLYRGEEGLGDATTAQDGVARLAAPGGVGKYALFAASWDTTLGDLDLSPGRRVLQLVEGASIAGRVIVDGEPPDEHFQLFFGTSASMPQLSRLMPQAARKLVLKTRGRLSELIPRLASDGSFVLRGLPQDVRGMFLWSPPYFIEGRGDGFDATHLTVSLPRSDLELRLISGLTIQWRVVDESAKPVGGAYASMWLGSDIGGDHPTASLLSTKEGLMEKAMLRKSAARIRLAVGKSNTATPKLFEFEPPANLRSVWDLGDLALGSTRPITVHVQDQLGEPIDYAIVSSWHAHGSISGDRPAKKGVATLAIGEDVVEIAARAFGFEGVHLPVPAGVSELTAVLPRACMLEISSQEKLESRDGLTLELSGPTPLFIDEPEGSPPGERLRSGQGKLYALGASSMFRVIGWNDAARWQIAALTSGQELRVKLLANGRELCNQTIVPLAPGEQRAVTLSLGAQAHTLRLRVLGPNGNRISAARISLEAARDASRIESTTTDGLGNATLQVFEERCRLYVRAESCAPKWVVVDPIPSEVLEIALEDQRTVEVELVEEDGAPYLGSAKVYWPSPMDGLREAQSIGPARYRLGGLPAKEIVLLARLDTSQASALHDASIPFARIVVGAKGMISVRMPIAQNSSIGEWFAALAITGSDRDCMRVELKSNAEEPGLGAAFLGVRSGSYDVWLEQNLPGAPNEWRRSGRPISLTIDAERMTQGVELTAP